MGSRHHNGDRLLAVGTDRERDRAVSVSGAIRASQKASPPTREVGFWPQSAGDCFPALEWRQPSLARAVFVAEVTVGEGASAPAREMTAVSQLEPHCVKSPGMLGCA